MASFFGSKIESAFIGMSVAVLFFFVGGSSFTIGSFIIFVFGGIYIIIL